MVTITLVDLEVLVQLLVMTGKRYSIMINFSKTKVLTTAGFRVDLDNEQGSGFPVSPQKNEKTP